MTRKNISAKKYYAVFSLVFLVVAAGVFGQFIYYGKTIIEYHDALHQYYASFEYFSDYMQNIIRTFFSTGHIQIPLWDFNIGMGADVITSLNYYVIGDPLNLIAIFFKSSQLEVVFQLLIIFRLYLGGLFFSVFCRKLGFRDWSTVVGAFIYSFSIFALYSGCMYAAFPNVLIYLPLLFLGIEKVFRRENSFLLMFVVALCLISNFYFSYMLAILAGVYFILRYFAVEKFVLTVKRKDDVKTVIKDFFCKLGRVLLPAVGGVLLSCAILFPVLYAFLNQGRGSGQVIENFFFYDLNEYIELLRSAFSPKISSNYNLMGYCPIVFCAVLLLFQKSKKRKRLKMFLRAAFIISGIFLIIPVFGYILNGFAYLNNRWIFGLAFLCAFTVVVFFDEFFTMNKKAKIVLAIGVSVYLVLYLLVSKMQTIAVSVGLIWMFAFALFIFFADAVKFDVKKMKTVLAVMCILCVTHYGYFFYSPLNTEIMKTKINSSDIQHLAKDRSSGAVTCIKDKSFYRVNVIDDATLNDGLLLSYPSTAFYYSLYDGKITAFNKELDNLKMSVPNLSRGNGRRTYLNLLTNVKYVVSMNQKDFPYGYEYYDTYKLSSGAKRYVGKNKLSLPFGYTVDSYMTREKYEKLTPLKKEQAMLQGAVVEQKISKMSELSPSYADSELKYSIKSKSGLEIGKNNTIKVKKASATLTLQTEIPQNSEVFVSCDNIKYNAYNPKDYPEYYGYNDKNKYSSALWKHKYKNWKEPDQIVIKASANGYSDYISLQQKSNKYYWNQDSFLISLGTSLAGKQDVTITFSDIGEYKISDIKILCENMTDLPSQVETLKSEKLENVKFSSNNIKGSINTNGNKMLMLSVPYSKGWSVTVDGVDKDLVCVNTMWSGVYLDKAGNHKIEMHYRTPLLKEGLAVSGATLVVTIILAVICFAKKRKTKRV